MERLGIILSLLKKSAEQLFSLGAYPTYLTSLFIGRQGLISLRYKYEENCRRQKQKNTQNPA